jgi:fatty acid desaturase
MRSPTSIAALVFMAATATSMMSLHLAKEATLDSEQRRYERAQARVKELKGFYTHATAYMLVNIGLFVINLLTGGGWWFYWPLLGWGIGLGIHALSVFAFGGGPFGRDWEERKTRELMDRDRER